MSIITILSIITLTSFAYITRKDFVMGVFFFHALLPSYVIRFQIGLLPTTLLELLFVILLLSWVAKYDWSPEQLWLAVKRVSKNQLFYPGLLLVASAGASSLWAIDLLSALGIWKAYFMEPFLFFVILQDQLKTKQDWKQSLLGLGIPVIFLTVISIIQRVTGLWSPTWEWAQAGTQRSTGVYTSPNALALFILPVIVLLLANYAKDNWKTIKEKSLINYYQLLVLIAGCLSLYLSKSRGAWIAFAVTLFFLLMKTWSKKKTIVLSIVCLCALFLLPSIRMKAVDLATFRVNSGQTRIDLYTGTWTYLLQHPFKGFGLSSFGERIEETLPTTQSEQLIYPHNFFLNFWAETGLLGLLATLWILSILFKDGLEKEEFDLQMMFLFALLPVLIHGLVDVSYFKNDLAMLTWFLIAGAHPIQKRS